MISYHRCIAISSIATILAASSCPIAAGEADAAFMARSNAGMTKMMAAMDVKPAGNTDQDFVAMMVPHHQGAIDMAEAELRYGSNVPLRRLAEEIVVTQREEIVAMRAALGNPKGR
jgi:uncharacterized protein (DUF305 family)